MSGSLQDHHLEDDEPLQVPLSILHPAHLSPQCLHEASPDLPARRVISPRRHDPNIKPLRLPCRVVADYAVEVCDRVGVDPVSVDLPETEVLRGQSATRLVPLLTFPIRRFHCLAAPFPLLRADGRRSSRGCWFVSNRSVLFPLSLCAHLGLPSLCASTQPLSCPCYRLLCVSYLRCPLLVPSGLRCDVGTLLQKLAGQAGVSGLAALASRGLAR